VQDDGVIEWGAQGLQPHMGAVGATHKRENVVQVQVGGVVALETWNSGSVYVYAGI